MRTRITATNYWTGNDVHIGDFNDGVVVEQRNAHEPVSLYDMATRKPVLRLNGHLTVPYGGYAHVLVTSEYSPLEPQTEQKYYQPGLGEVDEHVTKGHHEEFRLVSITH